MWRSLTGNSGLAGRQTRRSAWKSTTVGVGSGTSAAGLGVGLIPGLSGHVERATADFQDRRRITVHVLSGRSLPERPVVPEGPSALGIWYGLASGAGAVAVAGVSLFRRRLIPSNVRRRVAGALTGPVVRLRLLHSGHAGDYAAWFTVGLAVMTGVFALVLR